MTTTPLADFLSALWETGQVCVPELPPGGPSLVSGDDRAESVLRLQCYASDEQTSLPDTPPRFEESAAWFGATAVYAACSLIVHRRQTVEQFAAWFEDACLDTASPSVVYSVDLSLRFLPDVHRLAMVLSESDPLCDVLERLGRRWPLSAVGLQFLETKRAELLAVGALESSENPKAGTISGSAGASPSLVEDRTSLENNTPEITGWWNDLCLRQMYLDRIIERHDVNRLENPRVAEGVREVIGIHTDLSPKIAAALAKAVTAAAVNVSTD